MSFSRNSSTYIKEAINVSLLGAKFVPGLEPAALVVQSIVEQADKLKNNRETCDELVERVKISQNILEKYKPPDDVHKEAYRKYIDILKKIEEYIKQLRKPGNFSRRFINKITKFIHAKEDEQLLKHFVDALDHAINAFHLEVGIQVYESISNQAKELSEIKSTTLEIKSTLEIKNIAKGLGARRSDIAKTRLDQKLITDYPLAKDVVGSKRKALVKKMFRSQPVAVRRVVIEYSKVEAADKNKLLNLTVIGKLISDCKNIEKFHGTYLDSDSLYMVTEWVENGNLCDYLKKEPYLPWIDKWRIASEIANAINFCHGVEVLHHNIRAKNVLLDEHLIAKLSNFDTSRFTTGTTTTIPGIRDGLEWKAPEKIRSEVEKRRFDLQHYESEKEKKIIDLKHESLPFNKQMDVYSFGMTLWEIAANGESPFSKIEDEDLEHEIIGGTRPVIPVDTPPAFEKFISEAWNDKWAKRPKIEVIADNLFKNYQLLKEKNSQTKSYLIPPSTPHYQRPLTPVPSDDSLSGSINNSQSASSASITLPKFEEILKMHNERKYTEVLPYFKKYAEKGDPRGAYFAGKYLCEVNKLIDEERGLAFIQQAADAKRQSGKNEINEYILKAQSYYARKLLEPQAYQPKKAIYYLKVASSNRRYDADCRLAEIYMEGEHDENINLKKSEAHLKKVFDSRSLPKDGPIYQQALKLYERLKEYKLEAAINDDEKDEIY